MGKTPTTQKWLVTMPTSIGSIVNAYTSLVSWIPYIGSALDALGNVNVLAALATYSAPNVQADIIAGVYDVGFFATHGYDNVSAVQVTNVTWIDSNGKLALQFNMTTTSDPLTATDLVAVLVAGAEIVAALIFIASAWNAGAPIWLIAAVSGGVIITALITVSLVFQSQGGVAALIAPGLAGEILTGLALVAALGIGSYIAYDYFKGRKKGGRKRG